MGTPRLPKKAQDVDVEQLKKGQTRILRKIDERLRSAGVEAYLLKVVHAALEARDVGKKILQTAWADWDAHLPRLRRLFETELKSHAALHDLVEHQVLFNLEKGKKRAIRMQTTKGPWCGIAKMSTSKMNDDERRAAIAAGCISKASEIIQHAELVKFLAEEIERNELVIKNKKGPASSLTSHLKLHAPFLFSRGEIIDYFTRTLGIEQTHLALFVLVRFKGQPLPIVDPVDIEDVRRRFGSALSTWKANVRKNQ